jgi:acyl-CoA synthetase (AMP-forming)/AMP-acid ligase II
LNNSDSKALIFGEDFNDMVASMRRELSTVKHYISASEKGMEGVTNYEELVQEHSAEEPLVFVSDNDPAFIMYTAGTTGLPKGAVITHKNYMVGACFGTGAEMVRPQAEPSQVTIGPYRTLLALPVFHAAGTTTVLGTVFAGGTAIVSDVRDPESLLRLIQDERISGLLVVPSMWIRILEHPNLKDFDLSSLRSASFGGAAMPLEIAKKLMETFSHVRWGESFGQTEACGTCRASHEDLLKKRGSVGRPLLNVDVRIVDDDDNDVPVGEVGEILYRGPTIMREYYNNPEATAEAFRGGWFHSTDLVRRDEDGYIYVMGRKKDIITSGGENIYPEEIEQVLATHPKILESAAIGVPDKLWGENIKAIVVLKPGEVLSEEEIIEHCKQNLASYKKPKSVHFVEELPRNAAGKVLKYELRRQYGKSP